MLIKEYRLFLPMTLEEYHIGQLYMVAKKSKESMTRGEGVEILVNEPYENEYGKGQYTHKIFHLKQSLPKFASALLPKSALQIEEKSWNGFPYCKTIYTAKSIHKDGNVINENVFNCQQDVLISRSVEYIDIANDNVEPKDYRKDEDPTLFISKKTNRGPLISKDWAKTHSPIMTCYKLAKVNFNYWGFQKRIESFIHKVGIHDVMLKAHRALFCWMDEWIDLSMQDIREIETNMMTPNIKRDNYHHHHHQHEGKKSIPSNLIHSASCIDTNNNNNENNNQHPILATGSPSLIDKNMNLV
ncbi:phosphatidylinositol transfer protein [Cavenderia fasciculata]|uniref:Phosphatidylinositol transfer protein n=1 Tax=Cavenderia fasciculata TaxID=261658 RepID=F4PM87_CACFS|nr:phosphatidylinositol transfer protein [Cavenderia fasciculata]EGG23587.1 phosphatidylinositol transfer protein [Cavenderia fasciculata]|eukprot:XP_004361438.1 phosphatidylinositol transfer protein [Cavenderia fasciculata]